MKVILITCLTRSDYCVTPNHFSNSRRRINPCKNFPFQYKYVKAGNVESHNQKPSCLRFSGCKYRIARMFMSNSVNFSANLIPVTDLAIQRDGVYFNKTFKADLYEISSFYSDIGILIFFI